MLGRALAPARFVVERGANRLGHCGSALVGAGPWRDLVRAGPRVAGFVTRSQRRWQAGTPSASGMPVPRPSLALAAHVAFDELLIAILKTTRRRVSEADALRIRAETAHALAMFEARGWLDDPASYHQEPPTLTHPTIESARLRGLRFEKISFESGYEPHLGEPGRERWLASEPNRTAHAWVLRHRGRPRPWLVCIHGASMGVPFMDFTAFRAAWLHHELGLNVVVPVLPQHGPRRDANSLIRSFPTEDVLDTVHGLAQAVWDVRRILSWLRGEGATEIGLQGVSLGGYTAALCAAFDDDLACVIAGVPATDFPALFDHHLPILHHFEHRARMVEDARILQRVVSPLALPSRVPADRRFIFAGLADRMAHPVHQVHDLWLHWERPRTIWYEGSHVAFVWSGAVTQFLRQALDESGLVR